MRIIVLNYHRIFPGHHIDPEIFEWQIKCLKNNATPLSLEEVVSFAEGKKNLKKNGFVITLDDGWADNLIYAYPILKKYGVPATIFLPTGFIGPENEKKERKFRNEYDAAAREVAEKGFSEEFLTWQEIRQMLPLITFESHGHSHSYHFISQKIIGIFKGKLEGKFNWLPLSGITMVAGQPLYESGSALAYPRYYEKETRIETEVECQKRISEELEKSAQIITKETGRRPQFVAWPFGEYSEISITAAREAAFTACFTIEQGSVRKGDNLFKLKRFSPPRNRHIFRLAIKQPFGIALYRLASKIAYLLRLVRK